MSGTFILKKNFLMKIMIYGIINIFLIVFVKCQIISQSVTKFSEYSRINPVAYGQTLLKFSEIVKQRSEGNQVQQCPCVHLPGANKCITYDSRFQAAAMEEAILTFVDTSMDPRIYDDRLGSPISAATLTCRTEECRQCAAILAVRLRQLNLISGPPRFSFRLPTVDQLRPQLCRRLRLGRSVPVTPPPSPVPGYVSQMIQTGLQRRSRVSPRPLSHFGLMVQEAIRQAREFRGRPFFDAVMQERQERLQKARINNQNRNTGRGNGVLNAGSSGGTSSNSRGNNGPRTNIPGNQGSRENNGPRTNIPSNQGPRTNIPNPRSNLGNQPINRNFPSRPRWPPNRQGPVQRPLLQRARNFFQSALNQAQQTSPGQPNFNGGQGFQPGQVFQPGVPQPGFSGGVQPGVPQPGFSGGVQPGVPQPGFSGGFQPGVPQIGFNGGQQGSSQIGFNGGLQQAVGPVLGSIAQHGFGQGFSWGGSSGGHGSEASAGGSGSQGGSQSGSFGGSIGIGGDIGASFGRKKRAINDKIIGDRFVISCVERGNSENEETDFINLCTACWTWRQLPPDYFPRLINELVCQENDYCLSGWGSCQQRYRNVDVLRKTGNVWHPTTIAVATCCDCKVKAGTEVHSLVIGENKR